MTDNERLAKLEIRMDHMEDGYEALEANQNRMSAKLDEIKDAQINGLNQINLRLSHINDQIDLWKSRWGWFSKLTLTILCGVIVGIVMLWIKGGF